MIRNKNITMSCVSTNEDNLIWDGCDKTHTWKDWHKLIKELKGNEIFLLGSHQEGDYYAENIRVYESYIDNCFGRLGKNEIQNQITNSDIHIGGKNEVTRIAIELHGVVFCVTQICEIYKNGEIHKTINASLNDIIYELNNYKL